MNCAFTGLVSCATYKCLEAEKFPSVSASGSNIIGYRSWFRSCRASKWFVKYPMRFVTQRVFLVDVAPQTVGLDEVCRGVVLQPPVCLALKLPGGLNDLS